jgi:hypothetical protein
VPSVRKTRSWGATVALAAAGLLALLLALAAACDRREQFKWLASGALACFAGMLASTQLSSARG